MIQLNSVYATQRTIKRPDQILGLIQELQEGGNIPLIDISEDSDGDYKIENGHHRAIAYYLLGYEELDHRHYQLVGASKRSKVLLLKDLVIKTSGMINER